MLSRREQDGARARLRKTEFWSEDLRGVPATVYYRIDRTKLAEALLQLVRNGPTGLLDSDQLDGTERADLLEQGEPTINTETTQETTPETTTASPSSLSPEPEEVEVQSQNHPERVYVPLARERVSKKEKKRRARESQSETRVEFVEDKGPQRLISEIGYVSEPRPSEREFGDWLKAADKVFRQRFRQRLGKPTGEGAERLLAYSLPDLRLAFYAWMDCDKRSVEWCIENGTAPIHRFAKNIAEWMDEAEAVRESGSVSAKGEDDESNFGVMRPAVVR